MTQGIRKALAGLTKPRSGCGVGKGSHSPIQRVVEPAIRSVPIPDERMGFVRQGVGGVCRVQKAGGVAEVSSTGRVLHALRQAQAGGLLAVSWPSEKAPFPPAPSRSVEGDFPQFFPNISTER
jgi:hypothetical protein